jgi:uncharacterized membrane protein
MSSIAVSGADPVTTTARIRQFLTGLLLLMTPVGIILMTNAALAERYMWTTTIYLFAQCAVLVAAVLPAAGPTRTFGALLSIIIISLGVEYLGVRTGVPFGDYRYSALLQPLIAGIVPLAIGFAWIGVTWSSYLLVVFLAPDAFPRSSTVLLTASAVLALDIMLEPFAAYVNGFWTWSGGAVPFQNFISWFVLGMVFASMLHATLPAGRLREKNIAGAAALVFGINVMQFSVMNALHGHVIPVIVSFTVMTAIVAVLRTRRHAH